MGNENEKQVVIKK